MDGGAPVGHSNCRDRVAQEVARRYLEPRLEPAFHANSYGYRPGKSAIDAVRQARQRCWRYDWVLDLDVKAYFDSIDWENLLRAVRRHTNQPWVLLYIERWLKAPMQMEDGSVVLRTAGTPQGGVVESRFGKSVSALRIRYVDEENLFFLTSRSSATQMTSSVIAKAPRRRRCYGAGLPDRFAACKLVLHPEKTKIVYCKDANRRGDFPIISFDFSGFQFRARKTMWGEGTKRIFAHSFQPAASPKALTFISRTIRRWTLHRTLTNVCQIWPRCTTRAFEAGSTTTATSTERSCVRP